MSSDSPLILVDGSSYLFRAFYALPDLRTSAGFPTGAIRGVVSMLRRLQKDYTQSTIVVVFDAPGKTFRDDMFEAYKANRPSMPEDLAPQIQPIHEIVSYMGLPLLVVEGVEADDVIGTLAKQATEHEIHTVISTSDKDLAQLVNPHVTLVDTMKNETLDRAGVLKKFGVGPERIIDYLALMGDKVDNIPGVPSVGPKTATKWLTEYGSMDELVAHADQIKGKVGEKLREHLNQLPLSRALATIKCDVELPQQVQQLHNKVPNEVELAQSFESYELRTFLEEMQSSLSIDEAMTTVESSLVTTESQLEEVLEQAKASGRLGITMHVDRNREIVGVGLAADIKRAAYVLLVHGTELDKVTLAERSVFDRIGAVLNDPSVVKICHDVKTMRHVLVRNGLTVCEPTEDVMLASYVLNSVVSGGHGLRGIAGEHLTRKIRDERDICGSGAKRLAFKQIEVTTLIGFAGECTQTLLLAEEVLSRKLKQQPQLQSLYNDLELALEPALYRVECNGCLVDANVLRDLGIKLQLRMEEISEQAYTLAGKPFNLGSPKQIQGILYDDLQLTPPRKSKTGNLSTAEDVLVDLQQEHELPRLILDYRGAAKLKSTYTDNLQQQVDPTTSRIHTTYQQANASTGRLASVDPNLQNIPIRTEEGRHVREAFIAPTGCVLASADYSQIELRVMAHLANDPGLTAAFKQNLDIHQATAAEVFNLALDEVSSDERRNAKAINFGLMYGMSPFGLARNLGIPQHLAREYIDSYFNKFPNVKEFMDSMKQKAKQDGFVETLFGRRIYLNDINSKFVPQRQAAERLAINAPVQGTAADIIKRATIAMDSWLTRTESDAKLILQVHDELVFEVSESTVDELRVGVTECMVNAADLSVDLVVDFGVGLNWARAH